MQWCPYLCFMSINYHRYEGREVQQSSLALRGLSLYDLKKSHFKLEGQISYVTVMRKYYKLFLNSQRVSLMRLLQCKTEKVEVKIKTFPFGTKINWRPNNLFDFSHSIWKSFLSLHSSSSFTSQKVDFRVNTSFTSWLMPNTVPTVTQGVTVYSFLVAKCEYKGCGTVSAVVQKSSKFCKAHTVGRIQGNIQEEDIVEEQEKMSKSLRYILDRIEVRLKGSKSFCDWIHTSPHQTWLFCNKFRIWSPCCILMIS